MPAKLEVIVQNGEEAQVAELYGADRLELVSAIREGGLTPSYGTVKQVISSVRIPVSVMVRPHSYSFCYSKGDMEAVTDDIRVMKELGVTGIVFGCLTRERELEEDVLRRVISEAGQMEITFHRAMDDMKDLEAGYRKLCQYPSITRVLTSGGCRNAVEGKQKLNRLIKLQKEQNGPVIMPGAGIHSSNLGQLHEELQAEEYHVGSGVRQGGSFSKSLDVHKMMELSSLLRKERYL